LFTLPDQLSGGMVQQLVLKTLHHTVRQDVNYDLAALPEHQCGGATTIKLAMDKLSSDSFELRICIQQGITMFSITLYPKQDVTLAMVNMLKLLPKSLFSRMICRQICSQGYGQVFTQRIQCRL
jgi:hypothetical protein